MKKCFALVVSFILLFIFLNEGLHGQVAFIDGNVMNAVGQPLPGVTVSLAHQWVGRSTPSITNAFGYFSFANVPINNQAAYYFEIYWGSQLVYRNALMVNQPIVHLGAVIVQ